MWVIDFSGMTEARSGVTSERQSATLKLPDIGQLTLSNAVSVGVRGSGVDLGKTLDTELLATCLRAESHRL